MIRPKTFMQFGAHEMCRKGPIGALNRLLLIRVPAVLRGADDRITGGRASASVGLAWHYLMNENHPLVLVCLLGPKNGLSLSVSDIQ